MKKDFLLTRRVKNSEGGDANNGIYQVFPAAELRKLLQRSRTKVYGSMFRDDLIPDDSCLRKKDIKNGEIAISSYRRSLFKYHSFFWYT
jgi:hypothetical protein